MEANRHMRKDDIHSVLAADGFDVIGVVENSAEGEPEFFIYIRVAWAADGSQSPTNYQMIKAKDKLGGLGVKVQVIPSDQHAIDVEAGMRATLLSNYTNFVRNVFLSLTPNGANVWVDPKPGAHSIFGEIKESAGKYLSVMNVQLLDLAFTTDDNLPANFVLMRTLRVAAPVTLASLKKLLVEKKFTVPSDDWLRRKLDSLRKKGHVVWLRGNEGEEAMYALTLSAIRALGTEKSRSSPDVRRLLAITKRPT